MDSVPFHFCFFFLIIVFPFSSLAQTNGTIPVGTFLTATKSSTPWLSPSADFAFGFQFLPQNGLFLLSIWYYNLHEKTIVWYANDGNLVPSATTLELNAQNGLVLTDPQGTQLWSSLISGTVDHGFINDTGNFVLVGTDSPSVWESFDYPTAGPALGQGRQGDRPGPKNKKGHQIWPKIGQDRLCPTDTLLPTQTMEINGVLNSRKSDTNFSPGRFQFRLLEEGNAVLNPKDEVRNFAYESYYSSNTNDSSNPSNSGRQLVFNQTGHMFIVRRNGQISYLSNRTTTLSLEYYYRATLNFDGVFEIYSRPKRSAAPRNWTATWTKPDNICLDICGRMGSGACGYNSVCQLNNNRRPICECPLGYSLADPNDKYGSCNPTFLQSCDENGPNLGKDLYALEELNNSDWPFNDYEQKNPYSEEACRNSCLTDCLCAVAIHSGDDCWKKMLPLSNGRRDSGINRRVFLKFKKGDFPQKGPRRKHGTLILVVSLVLGSFVSIFVFLGVWFYGFSHIYNKIAKPIVGNNNLVETNMCRFSYDELFQATNGFNHELGRGSFGIVYKGVVDIGGTRNSVAIKKLDIVIHDSKKEFQAEVNVIATHHKNLVRLLGFCDDGENRLLVYEYMSNGNLASFLFGVSKQSWNLRTRIAKGIARGLLYLHDECTTQIIHCDIKPQNVLFDDYYNAKISNFGLATLLMVDESQIKIAIRGTKGYVAPEWFKNIPVIAKVDVYSFGVLLLEIVLCRQSIDMSADGREILSDWVWDCFQEGKLVALVENDVEALNDMKILERYVMVGLWCIQEDPFLRPSMRKVTQMIEGFDEVIPPPCPYPFSPVTMGPKE
ncbi:hypothetical protein LguiA_021994 [Lonicera macranthoides]